MPVACGSTLFVLENIPPASSSLPEPLAQAVKRLNFQAPGARGKGGPLFLGLRLGTPVCIQVPSYPSIIPTLNCRVQEFKTSLSED